MRVQIAKWGNSTALRLPKAIVEELSLRPGQQVDITTDGNEVRIKRVFSIPVYRMEDLAAEMRRLGPANEPDLVDWGPDVGAEIIDDEYSRGKIAPPRRRRGVG